MEKKTLTERVMEAISRNKFKFLKFHIKDGYLKITRTGTNGEGHSYRLEFQREGYKSLDEKDLSEDGVRLYTQGIAAHHLVDWTVTK